MIIKDAHGQLCKAELQNALLVPGYPCDIFSVNAAMKTGGEITFSSTGAHKTTQDGNNFDIVKHGQLYYLPVVNHDSAKVTRERTIQQLHKIMGHCNQKDLIQLEEVVNGLEIMNPNEDFFCDICCKGKQPHLPISKDPNSRATKPLELVHSDLSGPVTPTAKDGFAYCMNFVDDYSGMVFYYFLKKKSDATRALEKFLADVGTVKTLRSDNGGEYTGAMKDVLVRHSIKHQLSAPHTLQQNGTAERNWRMAYDMARCLILDSNLPKFLWTYAIATSGYIRKRCYQQCTKCTPYELFTDRKPNIRNMAAFGTKCYVVQENHKGKLDDRAYQGVFVGYDRDSPAYLIYDRSSSVIRKSRNVHFDNSCKMYELCDPCDNLVIVKKDDVDIVQNDDKKNDENNENIDVNDDNNDEKNLENDVIENNGNVDQLGRPRRTKKLPKHLANDYVLDYDDINMNVDTCYKMLANHTIPADYNEAMASPDADKWKTAMDIEMNSLNVNDTWDVVKLPDGKHTVGGKWVYNIKCDKNNEIEKFKARYVA